MKLQYTSDIHLEFYQSTYMDANVFESIVTPVDGVDALVLAGDIGYPESKLTWDFISWCCNKWRHVIWVFGNHEYYTNVRKAIPMKDKESIATDYCKEYKNLHVLHNSSIQLEGHPDFRILGTTLWTKIPEDKQSLITSYMNDCKYIHTAKETRFSTADWNALYSQNVDFLQHELNTAHASGLKSVIVTHHLPSFNCIQQQYKDSALNCGFASELDTLVQHPGVSAWICGHSHGQMDVTFTNTENRNVLVSFNARGYPGEKSVSTYNPIKVLEV